MHGDSATETFTPKSCANTMQDFARFCRIMLEFGKISYAL